MGKHKDNEGWQDLADRLGITLRQVHNLKRVVGAPEKADDPAWVSFYAAHKKNPGDQSLRDEKLREEIALLRIKRSREEGATVLVADVREFLGQMAARHAQLLRMKYDTELPTKLTGKDIVGIRQTIAGVTDEVGEIVNRGLLEWNPGS